MVAVIVLTMVTPAQRVTGIRIAKRASFATITTVVRPLRATQVIIEKIVQMMIAKILTRIYANLVQTGVGVR